MGVAVPTEQIQAPPEPVARTATARRMFKFSEFLDVGDGAAECEHNRDGSCENPEHFHAWCRLPNSYQNEDIRKKALAAKARQVRSLRDPESDTSVVLDSALAEISDPIFTETLIDELLRSEWAEDYLEAQQDVEQREEFEHVTQDREEFERLQVDQAELAEEEQSEEYKRLGTHLQGYVDSVRSAVSERQEPKRAELRERSTEQLLGLVRARRVEQEGDRAFAETYDAWMWFAGTYRVNLHETLHRPWRPVWEEIGNRERPAVGTMFDEPSEVIEGLRETYMELRLALHRGSTEGN